MYRNFSNPYDQSLQRYRWPSHLRFQAYRRYRFSPTKPDAVKLETSKDLFRKLCDKRDELEKRLGRRMSLQQAIRLLIASENRRVSVDSFPKG